MSVSASTAKLPSSSCAACRGKKGAPIAGTLCFGEYVPFAFCEECGRDVANAVGFLCIRDGGWSKLEPRKRRAPRSPGENP